MNYLNQLKRIILMTIVCQAIFNSIKAQHFNIATYNLRYANHGDSLHGNGWDKRYPVIANMVQFHGFDIFGTQEGLYHQLEDLKQKLPNYNYIGIGREDGKNAGEHSAIFYRTDKFELLEKGDFWLSTITDKPNKGWDAVLPRICSWGKFKEKGTNFVFYFFNLHMDHVGVQARAESAKLILKKIKEFPANMPAVLTGDFNVDQNNESYTLVNTSGLLKDGFDLAPIKLATTGTFNNFHTTAQNDSRIDHIFVTKEFMVKRYGILTDNYHGEPINNNQDSISFKNNNNRMENIARTPSDHFPVMIEIGHK